MNKLTMIASVHDNENGNTSYVFYRQLQDGRTTAKAHVSITPSSYNRLFPRLEVMVRCGEAEPKTFDNRNVTLRLWDITPLYEAHKYLRT